MRHMAITWNMVGYLKPSTESTYLLTNSPNTEMITNTAAAPRFILVARVNALPSNPALVSYTSYLSSGVPDFHV